MSVSPGSRPTAECFRFGEFRFDPSSGEALLGYAFDDGEPMVERIRFPHAPWPQEPSRQAAFVQALGLLHLVAGVSYYKACVPARLETGVHAIDPELASFLRALYVRGLGEFAWVNGLALEECVHFDITTAAGPRPGPLELPERALVAMGGGKDSLVSLELLRQGGLEVQPVCVGASGLIAETVAAAGLPLIRIDRTLAPELAELNAAGAWNGHVPVTAINSAILLCAALLYGFRWVVFSNEHSASEATLTDPAGRSINHQYSKSYEFEVALHSLVHRRISPGLDYFSLLRPLGELAVARRFSQLHRYHAVFSSCNRHFHQEGPRVRERWCGDCPKCRFTTLALAVFMPEDEVRQIIGHDLLADPGQEPGFRALCALGVDKPFECVGTVDESRAALAELARRPGWKDKPLVRTLSAELRGLHVPPLAELLQPVAEHRVPKGVLAHVDFGA